MDDTKNITGKIRAPHELHLYFIAGFFALLFGLKLILVQSPDERAQYFSQSADIYYQESLRQGYQPDQLDKLHALTLGHMHMALKQTPFDKDLWKSYITYAPQDRMARQIYTRLQ